MNTQIIIIDRFPTTIGDIQATAQDWINQILAGNDDPIAIAVKIKAIETILERVNKGIKEYVTSEAEKYGGTFEKLGVKIEVADLGVKYDYSITGDHVYVDLIKEIDALTDKRKAREQFLKHLPENGTVDPDTGLLITRPTRSCTRGVKITIK
jgi:hypothetical protein